LIEKGDRVHIVWGDSEQGKFVNIVCENIDKDTVMDLAMSMRP